MKKTIRFLFNFALICISILSLSNSDAKSLTLEQRQKIDEVRKQSVYYADEYTQYDYESFQKIDEHFKITKNQRDLQFIGLNRHIVVDEESEWASLGLQDYDEVISIQVDNDIYDSIRDIERIQNCSNCILSYRRIGSSQIQQIHRSKKESLQNSDDEQQSENGYTTCVDDVCTVKILRFDNSLLNAIDFNELKKAQEIVFDLRNSTGGEVQVLLKLCDFLFKKDETLFVEHRRQKQVEWRSEGLVKFDIMSFDQSGKRTTVLKNSTTMSCSEIFIAILADKLKNLTLIGDRTYGKFRIVDFEIIQDIVVWYTRSIVYFSDGKTYDKIGI